MEGLSDQDLSAVFALRGQRFKTLQRIAFDVPLAPIGKARPRARAVKVNGKHIASVYTPAKTRKWESDFLACAQAAIGSRTLSANTALIVCLVAVFERPKVASRFKKAKPDELLGGWKRGQYRHTSKPDLDNVVKAALDALGPMFDDRRVSDLLASKRMAAIGEDPHVQVVVFEVLADPDQDLEPGLFEPAPKPRKAPVRAPSARPMAKVTQITTDAARALLERGRARVTDDAIAALQIQSRVAYNGGAIPPSREILKAKDL